MLVVVLIVLAMLVSLASSLIGALGLMWLENLIGFWTTFSYWTNVQIVIAASLVATSVLWGVMNASSNNK